MLFDNDSSGSRKFWAQDLSTATFYQIDAQLLAENDLCYIWAEKGSGMNETTAQNIADLYKNNIYIKMIDTFSYTINTQDEKGRNLELNTVQYVNWLAKGKNRDGKLTILLMDIKDGYMPGVNESYVAGYFWSGNIYKNEQVKEILGKEVSNECDMIYVDTYPGVPGSKVSNETLAHEMQHLMNFAGAVLREELTDTWIDEGLSVSAEWVYSNEHSEQRMNWYNENENKNGKGEELKGLIDKGNNFFVWGNRDGENQYAVLDDYATDYLFFQWLRIQSDKEIYRKISASENYDYKAVVNAFNDIVSSNKYSDWEPMLKDWLAANYFKSSTGRYGYGSDTVLNDIKNHYAPSSSVKPTTIALFPGEGVYSRVEGSFKIPTAAGKINYSGLVGSAPTSSGSLTGGALLTYNANTDSKGKSENGTITGEAPPPSPPSTSVSLPGNRSLGFGSGPFPIGAGDMLRLKGKKSGFNDSSNFKVPDAYKGIIVNE